MALRCCGCWTNVMFLLSGFVLSTCVAQDMTRHDQEEYLKRFAHLGDENPDPMMQELREEPERQFEMAVRSFQRYAGLNVTGVVDEATVHMMKMPRCGVKDIFTMGNVARRRKRYAASSGDKWNKLHLTYQFENYTPDLQRSTVRSIFQRAFQMWSEKSALTFEEKTYGVPDIEIKFAARSHGDGSPFDGPGNTLAHAFFPRSGGDAHFDEDESWTDQVYSGTNLLQVAVHEIGHSLGLGHSDVDSAIMAPFYRGYKPDFRLDQDDIDGIRYLYGHGGSGGRPTTMGPPPATTPSHGTMPPPPPPGYCPLAGFCRDFDAIDVIENTIYVFKGEFYARLSRHGAIVDIRRIRDRWPRLPVSLDTVMATNIYVYFFKGNKYWRLDKSQSVTEGKAWRENVPIRRGFPGAPDNLDAAFVWSGNGRIYFIKGGQYYRYRGSHGVDPEYPLPLAYWKDVRRPVDDVFQHDGITYFFSETGYQVFDDSEFRAGYPRSTKDLMQCCTREQELLANFVNRDSSAPALKSASVSHLGFTLFVVSVLSSLP